MILDGFLRLQLEIFPARDKDWPVNDCKPRKQNRLWQPDLIYKPNSPAASTSQESCAYDKSDVSNIRLLSFIRDNSIF